MSAVALVMAVLLGTAPPASREHEGPGEAGWPADRPETGAPPTTAPAASKRKSETANKPSPPSPRSVRPSTKITVAVGLSPEAPGSKAERALLDRLAANAAASKDPRTHTRRLRPGAGNARRICRERRDDLVIMIGYVPGREDPVVFAHDCRLDAALGIRSVAAVNEPRLVRALWKEHDQLIRNGVRERRRIAKLGPGARAGIIAGVALVVIGVAVGVLVANALREEKVVLKVGQ